MTYVTETKTGGPTAWPDPEDAVDVWADTLEMRKVSAGRYDKQPTYPHGKLFDAGRGGKGLAQNRRNSTT